MSLPLLLIEMMNLEQKDIKYVVQSLWTERDQDAYLIREKFFRQFVNGRVAPAQVEREIGYLGGVIAEAFQGELSLEDFSVALLISAAAQPDFALQVAEEFTERTGCQPQIVAIQQHEEGAEIVDAVLLPPRWRSKVGETVMLGLNVWLDEQQKDEPPTWLRGLALTIIQTSPSFAQLRNKSHYLLTMAHLEKENTPVLLVLPWDLVIHSSAWPHASQQEEQRRAVAVFHLPCWYSIQVEERVVQENMIMGW